MSRQSAEAVRVSTELFRSQSLRQVQPLRQVRRPGVRRQPIGGSAAMRERTELINFAQRWAPYGGPPEDEVFVYFGLTLSQFEERLRACTSPRPASPAAPETPIRPILHLVGNGTAGDGPGDSVNGGTFAEGSGHTGAERHNRG